MIRARLPRSVSSFPTCGLTNSTRRKSIDSVPAAIVLPETFAQRFGVHAFLRRQAYQHIGIRAKQLHLRIVVTGIRQFLANALEIGRFRVTHLEQDTAREVDAELQAFSPQLDERDDDNDDREGQRNLAAFLAEKVDVRLVFYQAH